MRGRGGNMNIEAICHEEKTGNSKGGGLGGGGGMVGDVQGCGWLTRVKYIMVLDGG